MVGKGDKNPFVSFFKLFEGIPFFLSIYSIKIPPDSIKYRDAAHLPSSGYFLRRLQSVSDKDLAPAVAEKARNTWIERRRKYVCIDLQGLVNIDTASWNDLAEHFNMELQVGINPLNISTWSSKLE